MAQRNAPQYIRDALHSYDSELDVAWDDRSHGWRLVHCGRPCDFVLLHDDGRVIVELNHDETLRIAKMSDMHDNYGSTLKRWARMRGERVYQRRLAKQRRGEWIDEIVRDTGDFTRRDAGKAATAAKPFVEVHQPA